MPKKRKAKLVDRMISEGVLGLAEISENIAEDPVLYPDPAKTRFEWEERDENNSVKYLQISTEEYAVIIDMIWEVFLQPEHTSTTLESARVINDDDEVLNVPIEHFSNDPIVGMEIEANRTDVGFLPEYLQQELPKYDQGWSQSVSLQEGFPTSGDADLSDSIHKSAYSW